MEILFTRFPYASALGGAEVQTMALMDGLQARGSTVRFVGSCPVLLAQANIPIKYELNIGPPPVTKWTAISFWWRRRKMREQLIDMLSRERTLPDAVFMLSLTEKLLLTDWLVAKGVKVFWVEHDRIGQWLTWSPWLKKLKEQSQKATIICVSELSRSLMIRLGFDDARIIAIPNGIDLHRFDSSDSSITPSDGITTNSSDRNGGPRTSVTEGRIGLCVGCIARLSPEKGVDVLLQAAMDMPEVMLSIVGSGPDEGLLRTMISEYERRAPDSIGRIRVMQSVPDLGAFYRSLDTFVLPSTDHDPFGLVAAEAMNLGIATIVTDACGIAGYLKDGTDALIVQSGSVDILKTAIGKLKDTQCRQALGKQGQSIVRELFSVEKMVERYAALL